MGTSGRRMETDEKAEYTGARRQFDWWEGNASQYKKMWTDEKVDHSLVRGRRLEKMGTGVKTAETTLKDGEKAEEKLEKKTT